MIHWSRVPIHGATSDGPFPEGADVAARVIACEALRRGESVSGVEVGAERDAIDWSGLDEAITTLDARHRILRALAQGPIDPTLAEIARPFEEVARVRSAPLPPKRKG